MNTFVVSIFSGFRAFGLSGFRAFGLSGFRAFGLSGFRAIYSLLFAPYFCCLIIHRHLHKPHLQMTIPVSNYAVMIGGIMASAGVLNSPHCKTSKKSKTKNPSNKNYSTLVLGRKPKTNSKRKTLSLRALKISRSSVSVCSRLRSMLSIFGKPAMNISRHTYFLISIALLYVSAWGQASAQAITDSFSRTLTDSLLERKNYRVGARFG
jgi:hypothetical protein